MKLWRDSRKALAWYLRVMTAFLRAHPLVTTTSTVLFTLSEFMNLLAFFLPLKVLILAGSSGVPWYFSGFISPETKMHWVIGLAIAAVVAYILTLVLQGVSDRLGERGGIKVLARANEIGGTQRQREKAATYYSRLCEIGSGLLFSALVFTILGFLNITLVWTILGLGVVQFLGTMFLLGNDPHIETSRMQALILERTGELTRFFYSTTFLVCFLVLLVPFVLGQQTNVILAILSVLIIRFGLQRLAASVQYLASLFRARHLIDPLVFRDRKAERPDLPADQVLQVMFGKEARDESAAGEVAGSFPLADEVTAQWLDPAIPGVFRFEISGVHGAERKPFRLMKLSFAKHRAEWPEQEEILFSYISRSALAAPGLVSSFSQGAFSSQIVDLSEWESVPVSDWPDLEFEIFRRVFSLELPAALVEAYTGSRQTLGERISVQAVQKAKVAVDSAEEQALLDSFVEAMPQLDHRLKEVPLFPVNPDMGLGGVVRKGEEYRILSWCRWSLEPIGFMLPQKSSDGDLELLLESIRPARKKEPETLTVAHLRLVAASKALDGMLVRSAYKQAFREFRKILDNPLMTLT